MAFNARKAVTATFRGNVATLGNFARSWLALFVGQWWFNGIPGTTFFRFEICALFYCRYARTLGTCALHSRANFLRVADSLAYHAKKALVATTCRGNDTKQTWKRKEQQWKHANSAHLLPNWKRTALQLIMQPYFCAIVGGKGRSGRFFPILISQRFFF